jgi:hypothetical protein
MQVKSEVQIIMCEPTEGPAFVLVRITMECPICGAVTLELVGHHLQTIRDACIEAIDRYPTLCSGERTIIDRYELKARGNDPSTS